MRVTRANRNASIAWLFNDVKLYRRICLLIVIGACREQSTAKAPQGASQSLPAVPTAVGRDWRTLEGQSFTLRYPPNATLARVESHPAGQYGTAITGPVVHVPVPPEVGPSDGPAYQLVVSEFPNPKNKTTEQWVDSIRNDANAVVDSDSLDFIRAPTALTVNGLSALRLVQPCGDCYPEEIYLARAGHTVLISYVFDISFPGDRAAQRRLYSTILNTFAWKQ